MSLTDWSSRRRSDRPSSVGTHPFPPGQRLYRAGGDKALGHLLRTLTFWIVGLFDTVLIRPEDLGSWKNVVGWVLLVVALVDSVALAIKERASLRPPESAPKGPSEASYSAPKSRW